MIRCQGPPIIRVAFFSKEPLVCGPQRTLYPSLIGNIVLYTSLLTCLLMFTMDYKSLMMLPEQKGRRLDEPRLAPPIIRVGFFFSKEPLVCLPYRTLNPTFIENIVMYIALAICLLMFRMVYMYLMMLFENNGDQVSPCLAPTIIRVGFFCSKEPLVCGPQRTLNASFIENIVL